MTDNALRPFIVARVLSRVSGAGERRTSALRDMLSFAAPHLDNAALDALAPLVPELPVSLYEKWAGLFADRLLENTPPEQASYLCANTEESNAALLLVYAMFMESERMERVVADDLKKLAAQSGLEDAQTQRIFACVGPNPSSGS